MLQVVGKHHAGSGFDLEHACQRAPALVGGTSAHVKQPLGSDTRRQAAVEQAFLHALLNLQTKAAPRSQE